MKLRFQYLYLTLLHTFLSMSMRYFHILILLRLDTWLLKKKQKKVRVGIKTYPLSISYFLPKNKQIKQIQQIQNILLYSNFFLPHIEIQNSFITIITNIQERKKFNNRNRSEVKFLFIITTTLFLLYYYYYFIQIFYSHI